MKRIIAFALITLALAACTSTTEPPSVPGATTTTRFYGPTVADPQPLTPDERFVLDYRSMKPGDTRTDAEVLALVPLVCGAGTVDVTLATLAQVGYTTDEAGWLYARVACP